MQSLICKRSENKDVELVARYGENALTGLLRLLIRFLEVSQLIIQDS